MTSRVAEFVSQRWGVPQGQVHVDVEPLHGGLESTVALATISPHQPQSPVPSHLVIKQLSNGFKREADVYETLWRHLKAPPAVRMFGRQSAPGATYLYLERVQARSEWPWSDTRQAAAVCRALARLHDSRELPFECFAWDYETELAASAEATLQVADAARDESGRRYWRRSGDLKRVVAALPAIRAHLLGGVTAVIHGDMHPGNVLLRQSDADGQVVMIDWARARVGSPMEDVASWLHSLGCWEPQARRRHDTLMRAYLDARAVRCVFGRDLRVEYWFASVSNGLSGAIRYHLAVLSNPIAAPAARYDSHRALAAWTRVVRRAAALVSTSSPRCR